MTLGFSASAETVGYWDPVGKVTNAVEATVVTAGTDTLTGGWYVVTGEVSRNRRMNVDGAVNLILADGANLTVVEPNDEYNKGYNPGIRVESGKTLNIYAQSTDANAMGRLSATSGKYGAGIGGGDSTACGTVNIYGGKVTATGRNCGAGIGGGDGGAGGTISIFGGVVTASCAGDSGAGIGGGRGGAGGIITISGGTVTATGGSGDGGAGIGGGGGGSSSGSAGGTITISGGRVTATGCGKGAGIGGGSGGAGGDVTISGGMVVAKSGNKLVWDIGSGSGGGFSGEFVVKGGSVLLANSGNCRSEYPKNGDGTQVYCVTNQFTDIVGKGVSVRFPSAPFAYGDKDIFTDDARQVYPWLPAAADTYAIAYENEKGTFTELTPQQKVVVPGLVNAFENPQTTVIYAKPDGTLANADAIPVDARRTLLLGGATGMSSRTWSRCRTPLRSSAART